MPMTRIPLASSSSSEYRCIISQKWRYSASARRRVIALSTVWSPPCTSAYANTCSALQLSSASVSAMAPSARAEYSLCSGVQRRSCSPSMPFQRRQRLYFGDDLPHEWLFPRCKMTVHHGGSGTTHAALRSGRPTVVTPVWLDQFTYRRLVVKAGVGVGAKQLHKLRVAELAAAIRSITPEMEARAEEMGRRARDEDGAAAVVRTVEAFLREKVATGEWRDDFQERVVGARTSGCDGLFVLSSLSVRREPVVDDAGGVVVRAADEAEAAGSSARQTTVTGPK